MRDATTSTAPVQPADPIDPAQRIADLEDALEQLQLDADLEAAELRSTNAAMLAAIAELRRQLNTCERERRRLVDQLAAMDADNAKLIKNYRIALTTIETAEQAIQAMQAAGRQRIRAAADDASRLTFDAPELP